MMDAPGRERESLCGEERRRKRDRVEIGEVFLKLFLKMMNHLLLKIIFRLNYGKPPSKIPLFHFAPLPFKSR